MGKAAGVDPSWVNVGATEVTGRRRRHLLAGGLALTNSIFTSDAANTTSNLQKAVSDGSLAAGLSALGMTLDVNSITYSDAPDSGGSNTGAIVGGVIGGIAGVALLAGGAALYMKKKKDNDRTLPATAGTGTKSGAAMFSDNPLAEADVEQGGVVVPQPKAAATRTTTDNAMFNVGDPMTDSPRVATTAGVDGQNQLYDSHQSQLSEPDKSAYTVDETPPQSARSRLDSARSGLRSNPSFKPTQDISQLSDSEDEYSDAAGNNPMYQGSRAGTDLMASAQSDFDLDTDRTYDTAPDSSRTAATSARSPSSNPMFGDAASATTAAVDGQNPLFTAKK